MYAIYSGQVDDWMPFPPAQRTQHDYNVMFILNLLHNAVIHNRTAHDLGTALSMIQQSCEGRKSDVLDPDDTDKMQQAVRLAMGAAKHCLSDQCVFGEIEDGVEAISAQIFLWGLEPAERAKHSSEFRMRVGRNIRVLRNTLHNADIRLQNAKEPAKTSK